MPDINIAWGVGMRHFLRVIPFFLRVLGRVQETFGVNMILTMFYVNEEPKIVKNLSEILRVKTTAVKGD